MGQSWSEGLAGASTSAGLGIGTDYSSTVRAEGDVSAAGGEAPTSGDQRAAALVQRLRLALAGTRQIAHEQTVADRVTRFLECAAPVAGARFAALVVHASAGAEHVFWSTADPHELAAVQSVLAARTDLSPALLPRAGEADDEVIECVFRGCGWPDPTLLVMPVEAELGSGDVYLVGRAGGGPFCVEDEEVLRDFMAAAAVGVENAVQNEELGRRQEWLRALATVSRGLLSSAPEDEVQVWQQIVDQVHRLAAARTVTIATPSEDDPDRLEVRVAAGVGAAELPGFSYAQAGSIAASVMSTGIGRVVDSRDWSVSHATVAPELPLGALLAIPLAGQGGVRGAILVSRHRGQPSFAPADVAMAQDFANQAVIALELAETRAAQQRLLARTEVERLADTVQDQVIQRLFSIGLLLETGMTDAERPPWLGRAIEEINHTIVVARSSLASDYGIR